MKENMNDKYKYVLVALASILFLLFMYLNKDNIRENNNLLDTGIKYEDKLSDIERDKLISEANIFLKNNIKNIYYYFNKSYENINDIDNQTKLWIAYWYLKDDVNSNYIVDYNSDEILEKMQKVFGYEFNINFEDIKDYNDNSIYSYNKNNKKYEYVGGGMGASSLELVRNDFYSFNEKDGRYYLTYTPVFYSISDFLELGDIDIIDINYNKLTTFKFDSYEEVIHLEDDIFEEIKNKITKVTYIFEKEDDNLVLTGFKINTE